MAHTAAAKKQSEPKMSRALVRQETIAGYLFLLPSLIFFIGFVIYPMVMCIFTSFFDSSMNRADVFIGLQNYVELFHDSVFLGALRNTLIIVVVSVPITCIFSLWVASAIVNMPPWATSLFRVIFYLPSSPALSLLPSCGSGCSTTTTASSTIWQVDGPD